MSGPELLTADRLTRHLAGLRLGSPLHVLGRADSTNDGARRLAEGGAPEGTLVIAEEQTRGRGRSGRSWHSPPGVGLWFSVILRPERPRPDWPVVSPLAGLALVEALEELYGLDARLKWPNDVWVGDRKLAGLLAESQPAAGWIVLGMGINVHQTPESFPDPLRATATSLAMAVLPPAEIRRPVLLARVLGRLQALYEGFTAAGPSAVRDGVRRREMILGRRVRIRRQGPSLEGIAVDLGPRCELLVRRDDGGVEQVSSGHVEILAPSGS